MVDVLDVKYDPEAAINEEEIKKCDISHKETASVAPYIYVPNTPEEAKLIRKIDAHLFPMLWLMFLMNYLDRTNIGVSWSWQVAPIFSLLTSERQGRRYGEGPQAFVL